jgi:hypothetical protein
MNEQVVFTKNSPQDPPVNNPANPPVENPNEPGDDGSGLSPGTQKLIRRYQTAFQPPRPEGALIHVDEIATKVASFYEKLRGIIDWKEEHLIRRTAIERILKRRLISEISGINLVANLKPEKMAEPLVLELVRGGHFPNDRIPRKRLQDVQAALEKYILLLQKSPLGRNGPTGRLKKKVNFYNWLLEIAACEIEEILSPPLKQQALFDYTTELMAKRIQVVPEGAISEREKKVQTFIAVARTLFRLDSPIISYFLLKVYYPDWHTLSAETLTEVAKNLGEVWKAIEKDLNHPLANGFFRIGEQQDTIFLILGDVLENLSSEPAAITKKISQEETLKQLVKTAYDKRLATLKTRLFRMAIFSTLSVLLSSAVSLFIVEVPLARLLYGRFNLLAIIVDILLPTVLMFVLVILVRPPKKANLEKVVEGVKKVVYQPQAVEVYEIKTEKKRHLLGNLVIGLLYLLGSTVSLGLVFAIFFAAKVPIASVYIDTLNVAVIVFAALIIRQRAKELVVEERASVWEFFVDTLSVPVGRIGQWVANKWKEYNLVSVFFTLLIDAPVQALFEFVESWSSFIKDKKAQLR